MKFATGNYLHIVWFRYVLNMAIADTFFLLTTPLRVYEDTKQYNEWDLPEWLCKAKETLLFVNYYSSIFFLMVSHCVGLKRLIFFYSI